jgi:hypothetical protein
LFLVKELVAELTETNQIIQMVKFVPPMLIGSVVGLKV